MPMRVFKRRCSGKSADPELPCSPHLKTTGKLPFSGSHMLESGESGGQTRGNITSTDSDSSWVESPNSHAVETAATDANVQPPNTQPGNVSSSGSGNFFDQRFSWITGKIGQITAK